MLLRVVDSADGSYRRMDQFRRGIGLVRLGQRDPINEYRVEGFDVRRNSKLRSVRKAIYMLYHIKVESKVEQREVQNVHANVDENGNPVATNARRKDREYKCKRGRSADACAVEKRLPQERTPALAEAVKNIKLLRQKFLTPQD